MTAIRNCPICGLEIGVKSWGYCKTCRNAYSKRYRELNKGFYLYMIRDNKDGRIMYIGKTHNIACRISCHVNGHNESTKHYFKSKESRPKVEYLDVSGLVKDDMELRVLENELINLYKPSLNNITNTNYMLNNKQLLVMVTSIHSSTWMEFKHKKIA